MNFLGYVNQLITETASQGGDPIDTVVGQTGEVGRLVKFVRDADWYICNLWDDLKFLWDSTTGNVTVGSDVLPAPAAGFRRIIRDSLVIRPSTNNAMFPGFEEWHSFRQRYQYGSVKVTSDYPPAWSQKPDGTLLLSHKPETTYAYLYEFQKRIPRLSNDDDVSLIPVNPDDDVDYPRIMMVKAKWAWAEAEDAAEIVAACVAEYRDLLATFEAEHVPGREQHQMGRADQMMVVTR